MADISIYGTLKNETESNVIAYAEQLFYKYREVSGTQEKVDVKKALDELFNLAGAQLHFKLVDTLPESGEPNYIYLVPTDESENNLKDEYIWIGGAWELIGSTAVDLSDYYTKSSVDALILTENNARVAEDTAIREAMEVKSNKVTSISSTSNDTQYPTAKAVYDLASKSSYVSFSRYYYSNLDQIVGLINIFNSDAGIYFFQTDTKFEGYWINPLTVHPDYNYKATITSDLTYVGVARYNATAGSWVFEVWFEDDPNKRYTYILIENTGHYIYAITQPGSPKPIMIGSSSFEVYLELIGQSGRVMYMRNMKLMNNDYLSNPNRPIGRFAKITVPVADGVDPNGSGYIYEPEFQENYPKSWELRQVTSVSETTTQHGYGYNLISNELIESLFTEEIGYHESSIIQVTKSDAITDLHPSDSAFMAAAIAYGDFNSSFDFGGESYGISGLSGESQIRFNVEYIYNLIFASIEGRIRDLELGLVTELSAGSRDSQYPSAKCVYDNIVSLDLYTPKSYRIDADNFDDYFTIDSSIPEDVHLLGGWSCKIPAARESTILMDNESLKVVTNGRIHLVRIEPEPGTEFKNGDVVRFINSDVIQDTGSLYIYGTMYEEDKTWCNIAGIGSLYYAAYSSFWGRFVDLVYFDGVWYCPAY